MPLVQPLSPESNPEVKALADFFLGPLGFTPNSILTMQRRPAIAKAFIELNKAVTEPISISSELKRIIGYMTSLTAGCSYCQAHLALGSSRFGAGDEKIQAVWEFRTSELFTDAERAALEFAQAAASVPNAVTPEIAEELKRYWDDDAIVEILAEVALMGFLNRWNDSMGTELEDAPKALGERVLSETGWTAGKHDSDSTQKNADSIVDQSRPTVHLVGSVPLADAASVFEAVSKTLGNSVKRIPDGETGDRSNWIAWQLPLLEANQHMEVDPESGDPSHTTADDGLAVDDRQFRFLRVKTGVNSTDLTFESEYAIHAIASFRKFSRLREAGRIPKEVRFQVSLPTPYAVASLYVAPSSWPQFLPAYERAILRELNTIVDQIPPDQLAVQWDVCMEVMAWEGKLEAPDDDLETLTFATIGRLCDAVPPQADVGIHLCYGDPGHKHIVEPEDTRILVTMANGISSGASRPLNWVHMPVPKERDDAAYFADLKNLELDSGCMLYLGLVHFTDQDEGAARRIAAAKRVVKHFGLATECGFGRRPADTVIPLLELHQRCCALATPSQNPAG